MCLRDLNEESITNQSLCVLQKVHAEEEQTGLGLQQLLRPAAGGRARGEGKQRLSGAELNGRNPLREFSLEHDVLHLFS